MRLNNNIQLGSDVTTYYAAKIEMSDRDLYQTEINDKNYYYINDELLPNSEEGSILDKIYNNKNKTR